jgi:hypothetical protein
MAKRNRVSMRIKHIRVLTHHRTSVLCFRCFARAGPHRKAGFYSQRFTARFTLHDALRHTETTGDNALPLIWALLPWERHSTVARNGAPWRSTQSVVRVAT